MTNLIINVIFRPTNGMNYYINVWTIGIIESMLARFLIILHQVTKQTILFQLRPVCYWEGDGVQFRNPAYEGRANRVSLNQAKENFKRIGAIKERFRVCSSAIGRRIINNEAAQ
ncbi:CPCC family cysteine-rich protein [Pedobacter frigoris]|uniref:CPCC family cysteine-rich protein n=1 Tax=Pedobacter frigoris TaxID=2571272 RepID=UPI001981F7E5|nr:CPCC family cysteine-rich protein [Pedobacter frigoris]